MKNRFWICNACKKRLGRVGAGKLDVAIEKHKTVCKGPVTVSIKKPK